MPVCLKETDTAEQAVDRDGKTKAAEHNLPGPEPGVEFKDIYRLACSKATARAAARGSFVPGTRCIWRRSVLLAQLLETVRPTGQAQFLSVIIFILSLFRAGWKW